MTPTELRAAAKALAKRIGPRASIAMQMLTDNIFDDQPPVRVTLSTDHISLFVQADTFEEALAMADREWATKRAEYRREAITRKRAELAELEGVAP